MGKIEAIAYIADNQAKANGILKRVEKNEDESITFGEILQEEIDKYKKEATKDTDQSSPSSLLIQPRQL